MDEFLSDIILEWNLRLPTVILSEEVPNLCMTHKEILCLPYIEGIEMLVQQLAILDQNMRQDGIIVVGNQDSLVKELQNLSPALLRSSYPIFLPMECSSVVELRLDSNMIFYEIDDGSSYNLVDMFAYVPNLAPGTRQTALG